MSGSSKHFDLRYKESFVTEHLVQYNGDLTQVHNAWIIHVFTVIMPNLGKDLLRGLTTGIFINTSPFRCRTRKEKIPLMFKELFIQIFDTEGYLRQRVNGEVIQNLRQVLMMYYKLSLPFSPEQELKAHTKFIETDNSVKEDNYPPLEQVRAYFMSCLPDNPWDIRPHHATGKTSVKLIDNAMKRATTSYIRPLMDAYPIETYFKPLSDEINAQGHCQLPIDPPSRLTVVPKDSRGPRTICMEPHERMYVQKGLMQKIYDFIEFSSPAKGMINFTDQTINQRLAQKASVDCSYATIDLKDASDMVPWSLVQKLVNYDWFIALDSTRSKETQTLLGNHKLKKFAPMGSALCFPIEAILFWAIARTVCEEVYVYGDDIIVPTCYSGEVMSTIESFGLVINRDKSLTIGHFKESCGGDFFHGYPIDIVQLKAFDLLSMVSFLNNIREKFGFTLADSLVEWYESTFNVFIARELPTADMKPLVYYTPRVSASSVFLKRRYNKNLQKFEYRLMQPSSVDLDPRRERVSQARYLDEWMTNSIKSSSPIQDIAFEKASRSILNDRDQGFPNDKGEIKFTKGREKLTFCWVDLEVTK